MSQGDPHELSAMDSVEEEQQVQEALRSDRNILIEFINV